jgi:hypothetical protein
MRGRCKKTCAAVDEENWFGQDTKTIENKVKNGDDID